MIVMRLPLKQPSGVGVWSRYGNKLKLAAKIRLTKCIFMTALKWLINVYIHSHQETYFKCYLQKWKLTSNFIFKLQSNFLMRVSFNNKETTTLDKKSGVAKMKVSIDSTVMVSFSVLRYDCHVRTMIWHGSNISFPCKCEESEKVEYVIFHMIFNWTCYM